MTTAEVTEKPTSDDPLAGVVRRAANYLDAHIDDRVTLADLGAVVGMSPTHLQRRFKAVTGLSPREYVVAKRVEGFKNRLQEGPQTVLEDLLDAGFGSTNAAYAAAEQHLGMTPAIYGARGRGARIGYEFAESPFGLMLIGETERGICAVSLGESRDALAESLVAEFPEAEIVRGEDGRAQRLCDQIIGASGSHVGATPVQLDVHGTQFQWQVWRHLRSIPAGTTQSYAQVADAIGKPKAARAVARACAGNHVAMLIPCHRVVRGNGDLSGYRWGPDRKAMLLASEARNATESR